MTPPTVNNLNIDARGTVVTFVQGNYIVNEISGV